MYKTILVPLDGSTRAEMILPQVIELARRFDSRIVLLRVVDPVITYSSIEGMPVEINSSFIEHETAEAEDYLDQKCRELEAQQVQAVSQVRYGAIPSTILDVAREENADLIALASHGRTGLSRIFYGSVAAGVLNRADRPLLLIRSSES